MSVNSDCLSAPTLERWTNGLVRALPQRTEEAVKEALGQALGYPSWVHAMATHLKNDVDRAHPRHLDPLSPLAELPPVATVKGWSKRMSRALDLPVTQSQRAWAHALGHAHWRGLLGALEQASHDRQNPWLSASATVLADLLLSHWPDSSRQSTTWDLAGRFVPAFLGCLVALRDQGGLSFQDPASLFEQQGTVKGLMALLARSTLPPKARQGLLQHAADLALWVPQGDFFIQPAGPGQAACHEAVMEDLLEALARQQEEERRLPTWPVDLPDNVWQMGLLTARQQQQLAEFQGIILVKGDRALVEPWAQARFLRWERAREDLLTFNFDAPAAMRLQEVNPYDMGVFGMVMRANAALRQHEGRGVIHVTRAPMLTDTWGGLHHVFTADETRASEVANDWLCQPLLLASLREFPALCPHCRLSASPHGYRAGPGCEHCVNGAQGTIVMQEIMRVTPKIRDHLWRHRAEAAEAHWVASGGLSVQMQLADAVAKGKIAVNWKEWQPGNA